MKFFRPHFFLGALRRARFFPRLLLLQGWPILVFDCMGLRRKPYQLQTPGGVRCELRPGTSDWWIFLELFVFRIYERIAEQLRSAQIVFDIGANVGFFSLYAASLNRRVKLHAFEPFPENANQLCRNLSLSPGAVVQVHKMAVSDKDGVVPLFFTPGDDSGCSLQSTHANSCSVQSLHVNKLFVACQVSHCDVLKMDCEGSELAILRAAAPDTLARIRRAIIMEYHQNSEILELRQRLEKEGFHTEVYPSIQTIYAYRASIDGETGAC